MLPSRAYLRCLTIKEQDFERFSRLFDEVVKKELDEAALKGVIMSDGELKPEEFSMHVAEQLRSGGPFSLQKRRKSLKPKECLYV